MAVKDWSTTANDNQTADAAINWLEGQASSTVNNSARGMMAETAKWFKDTQGLLSLGGTATVATLTTNNAVTVYEGQIVGAKATATNTGALTLNVDGGGASAVKLQDGTDPAADDIQNGGYYWFRRNASSQWVVLNVSAAASSPANMAVTDADNSFSADQTVVKASLDAKVNVSRTTTTASAGFIGAVASAFQVGSSSSVIMQMMTNNTSRFEIGTTGGLYAASLSEPAAGEIDVTGYNLNGLDVSTLIPKFMLHMYHTGGTPTIRGSEGVSSLTDNAVGDVTVNLTNAFSDATWVPVATGGLNAALNTFYFSSLRTIAAGSIRLSFINHVNAADDQKIATVIGLGDLA